MSLITAKEAFEVTSTRSQKVKEEKFLLVDKRIRASAEQESLSTKFSFAELRPFAGLVIEQLTELGYRTTQTGQFVFVEWGPAKPKPESKATAQAELAEDPKSSEDDYSDDDDNDEEYDQDDSDIWNT